ncbi:MAG: hypothetical protein ABFD54_12080 [Armatimonadota bacterium]|nr:hypothetical protein [bacterium]
MRKSLNQRVLNSRGQTLVIAIMVMFILAVVSGVFIALVARNLFRSERSSHVDSVAQMAESGIRYADKMLTTSEEGADWRPKPDNISVKNTPIYPDVEPDPKDNWEDMRDQNPDFRWTRAWWPTELGWAGPTGGYTTFSTGDGRFLLRISYNPTMSDPLSKYIKIESIGRWGVFDEDDPTTNKSNGDSNLRREITAYKPIGVTDYLRFITNKDNRSVDFPLGCPGFKTQFGRPGSSRYEERGAPIRVNGNLLWYGQGEDAIMLYLRGIDTQTTGNYIPIDQVEVAGDIKIADDVTGVRLIRMYTNGNPIDTTPIELPPSSDERPSSDGGFTTASGFYRDSRSEAGEATRRIKRIEPPFVDQQDTSGTTTRYRVLTLDSGERINVNTDDDPIWVNNGRYGWGRGIYIGNLSDTQEDSNNLFGGYSLRSDWLKPNNAMSRWWTGPYYTPPGVIITFKPNDIEQIGTNTQYYFTITRNDINDDGSSAVWYDPEGRPRPDWGRTIRMPYPDSNHGRYINFSSGSKHIDGNGVIYAEGNVRIRGMLPKGMQITVVSNENIYIEGNLLKYRNPSVAINDADPWRGTGEDTESCGLALLARESVCVNTTQFFAPLNSAAEYGSDSQDGRPPFHYIVTTEPDSRPRILFDFGPYESETNMPPSDWMLFLRHAGEYYGSSYINAWISDDTGGWSILRLNTGWSLGGATHNPANTNLPSHVWGIGDPHYGALGWGAVSSFIGEVFPLSVITDQLQTNPGIQNQIMVSLDQTSYTRNNYWMGAPAVQPCDIRIEAVIYAQEGSFYVLPGSWFNSNPQDTSSSRPDGVRPMFPYFGQPLDIRVIIDGAISENMPAPISDVEDWMSKWGKIPASYGSSSVPTAHSGEGLTMLYDDHAGWPYKNLRSGTSKPIRIDHYGRTLPITPRLPVSRSLIYFGDVM